MVSRTHIPRPPLSDFVEVFWQYDGLDPSHARERCLPTGTMEIVVDLRDDEMRAYDRRSAYRPQKLRRSLVCGAHSGFFVIDTTGQASTIGVHFKPGGAFRYLVPAGELRDALVPLESLWEPRPRSSAIVCSTPPRRRRSSVFSSKPSSRGQQGSQGAILP